MTDLSCYFSIVSPVTLRSHFQSGWRAGVVDDFAVLFISDPITVQWAFSFHRYFIDSSVLGQQDQANQATS